MSTLGTGTLGAGTLGSANASLGFGSLGGGTLGTGTLGAGTLGSANASLGFGSLGGGTLGTPAFYGDITAFGWTSSSFGGATVAGTASFAPDAWESSAFGDATIINFHSFVDPIGFTEEAFGDPLVLNWMQYAYPPSIDELAFGTHDVTNFLQYIEPIGIGPDPNQVPDPTQVVDPLQFITGVGGLEAPSFPLTHYVADYYQFIDLNTHGPTSYAVSTPAIGYRVRTIEVPFIVNTYFGATTVDNNDIRPAGISDGAVGNGATVELGTRYVAQHSSLRFTLYGTPSVQLLRQYVGARSVYEQAFGAQDVQNYIRYVYPGPYYTNSPPNVLGDFAHVRNRNVTLAANSFVSSKFGSYTAMTVRNKARGIAAEGINSLQFGTTDVSHWIRTLTLTGFDSFVSRHWHVVYNNAVVAAPPSISGGFVERPSNVYNRNRYLQPLTVGDGARIGTAFIAPRIRTLTQFNSYPHLTGYFGVPSVRYSVHPIAPLGFVPEYPLGVPRPNGLFGATLVRGPFIRTILPRGPGPERLGNNATITNRNKVIRPPGTARRDEFGPFTRVDNYTRYLPLSGWSSSRIGAHTVSDRTRTLGPATLTLPLFPITHSVRNLLPDPPSVQYLFVPAWDINWIAVPSSPEVRFPTIYPEGWISIVWGRPTVRGNEIKVDRGVVNLDQVGSPWVRGTQFLYPEGWLDSVDPPKQRVTPHTIYAPFGDQATAQARANHPTDVPNVIGPETTGLPDVTHRNRMLMASGALRTAYGTARVDLHRRYVTPIQIKSLRMGRPVILGVPQYINCDTRDSGFDASAMGAPAVARVRVSPEYIRPVWSDVAIVSSVTEVSNFVRTIDVEGIPHRGNPQEGLTNPWGLPEVHPPRRLYPEWFRSSEFGAHRVEHRIRNLYTEGFDSCSFNEEDIPTFNSRMRVKGRRIVLAPSTVSASTVPQPVVT